MSTPVLHGQHMRLPVSQYRDPELMTRFRQMMRSALAARARAEGWTPGEETETVYFTVAQRVQHHRHGWQIEERPAPEAEAQYAHVLIETMVAP